MLLLYNGLHNSLVYVASCARAFFPTAISCNSRFMGYRKPNLHRSKRPRREVRQSAFISPYTACRGLLAGTLVAATCLVLIKLTFHSRSRKRLPMTPSTGHMNNDSIEQVEKIPVRRAHIVTSHPHDLLAFTQGLSFNGGYLYESTGINGKSSVRQVEIETGRILRRYDLPSRDFGEGCVAVGDEMIQVIWKTGTGYVYSLPTLHLKRSFRFDGDGWGLAVDDEDSTLLYLSDGSDEIRVMRRLVSEEKRENLHVSTVGMEEISRLKVRNGRSGPGVALLNELEVVGNELWANIWMSDLVARIDKRTGIVKSWVDMQGLLTESDIPENHKTDVLNGMAYNPSTGQIYVTGKLWPRLFEIRVEQKVTANSIQHLNPFFTDPSKVRYIMSLTL